MGDRGCVDDDRGCVDELVNNNCPQFVQDGCGLDPVCGACAQCLETVTPVVEWCSDVIWIFGSPLAFPIIFFFDPETTDSGGWQISMLQSPMRRPIECCLSTLCCPCGQWYLRYKALDGDMTKYKLWQGRHDGPQCCARRCEGAPITIQSGTYGEQNCPHAFLCAEVTCLAGIWSICCAHDVTRSMIREDYNLGKDPTEIRQEKCVHFFQQIASKCCMMACCMSVCGCCIGTFAQDSEGAQECSGEAGRASRACFSIVRTIWRGIWSVKVIAIGCMSAQGIHEMDHGTAGPVAPKANKMEDRGESPQAAGGNFADALK